jgi:hypothetical protein
MNRVRLAPHLEANSGKRMFVKAFAATLGLLAAAVGYCGLEVVTHIQDLNASWPLGSDQAATADDHIRNIKSALKTDFPNFNGTVNAVGAPVFGIPGDADTGMYESAANDLAFAAGGTKVIDSAVGTTTVGGGSFAGTQQLITTNTSTTATQDSSAVLNAGSTAVTLYAANQNRASAVITNGPTTAQADLYVSGTNPISFGTNSTERMRIGGNGGLTVDAPSGTVAAIIATGVSGSGDTLSVLPGSTTDHGVLINGKTSGRADVHFQVNTVDQAFLGMNAGAGDLITGSSAGSFVVRAKNTEMDFSPTDGANIVFQLGTTPIINGRGPVAAALVDMTPDTGTFTATLTGGTAANTCTARWTRIGNLVMLEICAQTVTSNATSFTMTGLPAAVQPTVTQHVPVANSSYEDNSVVAVSTIEAVFTASSGTITYWHNGASTGWTSSGVKGTVSVNTVSYLLN